MNSDFIPRTHSDIFKSLSNLLRYSSDSWLFSTSSFFSKVGAHEANLNFNFGSRANWTFKAKQILKYYFVTLVNISQLVLLKVAHIISRQNTSLSIKDNVILDSYAIVGNLLKGQRILSDYLPNLIPVLEKEGFEYVILPRLYGSEGILNCYRLFKYWRKNKEKVVTESQLISFTNLLQITYTAFIYPFFIYIQLRRWRRLGFVNQRLDFFFGRI